MKILVKKIKDPLQTMFGGYLYYHALSLGYLPKYVVSHVKYVQETILSKVRKPPRIYSQPHQHGFDTLAPLKSLSK